MFCRLSQIETNRLAFRVITQRPVINRADRRVAKIEFLTDVSHDVLSRAGLALISNWVDEERKGQKQKRKRPVQGQALEPQLSQSIDQKRV